MLEKKLVNGAVVMDVICKLSRVIKGAIVALSIVAAVGTNAASAQQTPSVSSFLANPSQLLQLDGGSLLSNAAEQLALTDPSTFGALLGLLPNANDAQKGAIGRGLAQAAKVLVLTNQELAVQWQQQIALVNDPSFKSAAAEALADVKLGSVGGGPGTGLGGPGGGPAGGALEDIRPRSVGTLPFTVSASTAGAGVPSTNSTTGFTSCVGVNCAAIIDPVSSSAPQ
jgi:hypothetical protein